MLPGGGCAGCPPLLPGPDLGTGFPPLGGAPDGSSFLRSSREGSSFFDGLSVARTRKHENTRRLLSTISSISACHSKSLLFKHINMHSFDF